MKKIIAASLGTCVGIFVAASFAFAQAVPLPPPPPPPVPGAAFAMIALLPSPPPPPPSPAALIRYDGDPRVYVLEGGMKHWIKTAQDFKDLGYDWNAVSVIPA